MEYKPGDIANGHVLGSDLVWHRVSHTASNRQLKRSYWERYRGRWAVTGAVLAALTIFAVVVNPYLNPGEYPDAGLVDIAMAGVIGWLFNGSIANLLVAVSYRSAR